MDLAAPGENIYSTLSIDTIQEIQDILLSNGTSIQNQLITNAPIISETSLVGELVDCGIGGIGEFPVEVNGNIALIQRGTLYFSEKVTNAMNAGAIATIIYNNVEEYPDGMRPWLLDGVQNEPWIPSLQYQPSRRTNLASITTIDRYSQAHYYNN